MSCSAVSLRCSIEVGRTSYTEDELLELIDHMGIEYSGRRYHLLQTNCNNFSSDLCYALCGKRPPGWTNRLAGVAVALHCLCPTSLVPPLQPPSMCPYGDKGTPLHSSSTLISAPASTMVIGCFRPVLWQLDCCFQHNMHMVHMSVSTSTLPLQSPCLDCCEDAWQANVGPHACHLQRPFMEHM